jgi:tetratricopeptide (TPR) repeat protein
MVMRVYSWFRSCARWRASAVLATWLACSGLAGQVRADRSPDPVAALTERIAAEPNNALLHHQRAELERARGDYASAFADYDRAEKLDPQLHVVHLSRGRALLESNRSEAAIASLTRFLERHPGHYQALLLRARAHTRLAQHADAERDFGAALVAMADPSPDVYLERAGNLVKAGQREAALAVLDEGMRSVGQVLALEQAALELELELGRTDAALARLDAMLGQSSRREALLAKKAAILDKAGRKAEARLAREEALTAIEHLPQAKRALGPTKKLRKELVAALEKP